MALTDRLAHPPKAVQGLPCSIGATLSALADGEREALQAMLDSSAWSQTMIWDALRDEGYDVGRQSINRHRAGRCRCAL